MRQLVAGNWKMNGGTAQARALAEALHSAPPGLGCDLLVCPPATQIALVAGLLAGTGIAVGGQDCSAEPPGAHTGDIAADMLADAGCTAVILGHSERRQDHGETDALVRAKAAAAARAGLLPIVCVGETEAERDAGREAEIVCSQIAGSLPDGFAGVIAYEPIWAIGTGRTPTEADVETVHRQIRSALIERLGPPGAALRILYGGSVKPDNAKALLAVPEVGGALVGGASLQADSFLAIARAAATITTV
jgi:triosephosphate isomerase